MQLPQVAHIPQPFCRGHKVSRGDCYDVDLAVPTPHCLPSRQSMHNLTPLKQRRASCSSIVETAFISVSLVDRAIRMAEKRRHSLSARFTLYTFVRPLARLGPSLRCTYENEIRSDVYPGHGTRGGCRSSTSRSHHRHAGTQPVNPVRPEIALLTTPAKIDHFPNSTRYEPHTNATFSQRYFYDDSYYKPGGPVFLYIGGETSGEYRFSNLQTGSKNS